MRQFFLLLSLIFVSNGWAQNNAPQINWAFNLDGYNTTDLSDMVIDSKGFTYVGVQHGSGLEVKGLKEKLERPGHVGSGLIKFSPEGKPLWILPMEGTSDCRINSMHLAKNGDILISGQNNGVTRYGSVKGKKYSGGKEKEKYAYHQPQVAFLARYSSDGEVKWVKELDGYGIGKFIAERHSGEILWSVEYRVRLLDGKKHIDSTSIKDSQIDKQVIIKVDEDGTVKGLHPFEYMNHYGHPTAIDGLKVDKEDNLIIYGLFHKTLKITSKDSLTHDISTEDRNAYLLKFDSNDSFLWGHRIGGRGYQHIYDVNVNEKGQIYAVGTYGFECIITNGISFEHKTEFQFDIGTNFFYCKFSKDGNLLFADFSNRERNAATARPMSSSFDHNNRLHIVGSFTDTIDFDGRVPPIGGIIHDNASFYSRWKEDSIEVLSNSVIRKSGWNSASNIEINGKYAVVGGSYWKEAYIPSVRGKEFKFSEYEHGRSCYIYGFHVPKEEKQVEEEKNPLEEVAPILACLPAKLLESPNVWVPIDRISQNPVVSHETIEETNSCGVIRENASALLAPNPTFGKTQLILTGLVGKAKIQVLDMKGTLLLAQDVNLIDGSEQSFSFNFSNVAKGTYIIQIIHNDFQKILRLVKQGG